jgi:hypothetical protein
MRRAVSLSSPRASRHEELGGRESNLKEAEELDKKLPAKVTTQMPGPTDTEKELEFCDAPAKHFEVAVTPLRPATPLQGIWKLHNG